MTRDACSVRHVTEEDEISDFELRKKWGKAVEQARIEAGMSQRELAAAADIAQQNISALERGVFAGLIPTQVRIARVRGKSHRDLFYDPRLEQSAS